MIDNLAARIVILGMMVATAAPVVAAPREFAATSPWLLRYDEDRCRAVREFGAGENLLTLWLDQSGIQPTYNVSVVGAAARLHHGHSLTVRFGGEKPSTRSFVRSKTVTGKPVVTMYGVGLAPAESGTDSLQMEMTPLEPARETAIDRIAFGEREGSGVVLLTGSLAAPLTAMRTCADDLVRSLTVDGATAGGLARGPLPRGNPGTWIDADDYPAALINEEVGGEVRFTLVVNSVGTPTACHVRGHTRSEVFKDVVCLSLLARARFEPALDSEGRPRASSWSSNARFEVE